MSKKKKVVNVEKKKFDKDDFYTRLKSVKEFVHEVDAAATDKSVLKTYNKMLSSSISELDRITLLITNRNINDYDYDRSLFACAELLYTYGPAMDVLVYLTNIPNYGSRIKEYKSNLKALSEYLNTALADGITDFGIHNEYTKMVESYARNPFG